MVDILIAFSKDQIVALCDAPNPALDGVSSEGVTLQDWDSLTFSFSELTPVPVLSFICTIYVINKKSFIYTLYIPP